METTAHRDERILVFAPVGRDAALIQQSLAKVRISASVCADAQDLCSEVEAGVGGVLLTQEALTEAAVQLILNTLGTQPSWSDIPLVVLVSGGAASPSSMPGAVALGREANATFLERPTRTATLVGAVQVALRARRRQYELRDQIIRLAEAQEAERQARSIAEGAVRVRDEFLGSVAHDLKNPLGAIKAFAQLLQRQVVRAKIPESENLMQGLGRIDAMVTRTVAQLDELLDVARLQGDQPLQLDVRETDIVGMARRVTGEYQQTTSLHQIRVDSELPALIGLWDSSRLERVLGNLLSNAIKYSPNGGEIVVTIERDREPIPHAVLTVRDQGIGIPSADLPQIFERFYRASNATGRLPGTGIGLAGVRQIIEQHGGSIGVSSQEGQGSTFTVRLPISCDPPCD
jgi:signal transduction histidine kinase